MRLSHALYGHAGLTALRAELAKWLASYNDWRPHQHLGNLTPSRIYAGLTLSPEAPSSPGRAADGTGSDEF